MGAFRQECVLEKAEMSFYSAYLDLEIEQLLHYIFFLFLLLKSKPVPYLYHLIGMCSIYLFFFSIRTLCFFLWGVNGTSLIVLKQTKQTAATNKNLRTKIKKIKRKTTLSIT